MPSRSSRSRSRRAGRGPWRATLEQSGAIAIQRLVPLTDLVQQVQGPAEEGRHWDDDGVLTQSHPRWSGQAPAHTVELGNTAYAASPVRLTRPVRRPGHHERRGGLDARVAHGRDASDQDFRDVLEKNVLTKG